MNRLAQEPEVRLGVPAAGGTDTVAAGMPLLQLHGVHRDFRFGELTVPALRGVDLEIQAGEFVAVWGPSGSGKSTLMNLVGLIDRPSSGHVYFAGRDTLAMSDDEATDLRNQGIGFVFQSFNLVPVLSALDNVTLPLLIRPHPPADAMERGRALLQAVGLEKFEKFLPDRLSGGQRQRVAIARALIGSPKLVIADEPTANLDTENSEMVVELMRRLNQSTGVTFVFTTHDPRLLAHVRRQVLLKDGAIAQDELNEPAAPAGGSRTKP